MLLPKSPKYPHYQDDHIGPAALVPLAASISFPNLLATCFEAMITIWAPLWRGLVCRLGLRQLAVSRNPAGYQKHLAAWLLPLKLERSPTHWRVHGPSSHLARSYLETLSCLWTYGGDLTLGVQTPFRNMLQRFRPKWTVLPSRRASATMSQHSRTRFSSHWYEGFPILCQERLLPWVCGPFHLLIQA